MIISMKGFREELEGNILPFWSQKMVDKEWGGFYGRIDGNDQLHKKANKGVVLNARLLWTFSAAYRVTQNKDYLELATRAFDYLRERFLDLEYGGLYWELNYKGEPVDRKKQTYAQGFALYGFSEYYRATKSELALELSIELFELIERQKDRECGGYFEAFGRDWSPIEDVRLSDKDANEQKSMNTHLHILEPYTNLLRIWRTPKLLEAQKQLINIFITKIAQKERRHLNLFFDEKWNVRSSAISYGHDIEAAWLLYEAAIELGDSELLDYLKSNTWKMADSVVEGLLPNGGVAYEREGNRLDKECHWWVQAEAVVGFCYAHAVTSDTKYINYAGQVWQFIQRELVDHQNGEWHWSILPDGTVNREEDKAGFWKCPYHNSRMCLEMIDYFQFE